MKLLKNWTNELNNIVDADDFVSYYFYKLSYGLRENLI